MFTILFAVANLLSLRSRVDAAVAVDVDATAADSVVFFLFLLCQNENEKWKRSTHSFIDKYNKHTKTMVSTVQAQ